ncbi:uncharacterized protein LOC142323560 [Lycorma delicatula]|uniref:uncharacterized protein LOC142323560 n=1 Tax=Lycorma delicatula TaxID=130591 RepID=UPI003F5108FF
MGSHHSHECSPRNGISRNNSGGELSEKAQTSQPVDRLAKLLMQKTVEEDSVQGGITCDIFTRYVFSRYPDLSRRIFSLLANGAGMSPSARVITQANFRIQVDKLLSIISYEQQAQMYVSMYSTNREEISPDEFQSLLMVIYNISMDHYPEGPQSCRKIFNTIQAVVDSAFHKKSTLSVTYLAHWIQNHCPRLIVILHRYVIHVLSTAYRGIAETSEKATELELSTPVLEKTFLSASDKQPLLPVSQVWILSTTLPSVYTRPSHISPSVSNNGFNTQNFLSKILDLSCPSHWTLLYNSNQHGLSSNRFLHHVLSYKGPTLIFLRGEQDVEFCMAVSEEWHESHQYWGGEDSIIIQILPRYHVIEKGPKMIYLNFSIRGYPHGVRAGTDPRKPSVSINESFSQITYCGIPYTLFNVEVWGCGTPQNREVQLDIRKWEVKQAEKQRAVKMKSSDWIDHPDRYLLELAGRTNYSDSSH